jgi:hypothetical protein
MERLWRVEFVHSLFDPLVRFLFLLGNGRVYSPSPCLSYSSLLRSPCLGRTRRAEGLAAPASKLLLDMRSTGFFSFFSFVFDLVLVLVGFLLTSSSLSPLMRKRLSLPSIRANESTERMARMAILLDPGCEFWIAKKPGVGVGSESATLRNSVGIGIARVHMPLAKGKSGVHRNNS